MARFRLEKNSLRVLGRGGGGTRGNFGFRFFFAMYFCTVRGRHMQTALLSARPMRCPKRRSLPASLALPCHRKRAPFLCLSRAVHTPFFETRSPPLQLLFHETAVACSRRTFAPCSFAHSCLPNLRANVPDLCRSSHLVPSSRRAEPTPLALLRSQPGNYVCYVARTPRTASLSFWLPLFFVFRPPRGT